MTKNNKNAVEVLKRLENSIDRLENAVDGYMENEAVQKDFEAETQRMGADRIRLAESLDKKEAERQHLINVNREVSSRLVNAMETIRNTLEKVDGKTN